MSGPTRSDSLRERAAKRRKATGDQRAAALPGAERALPPAEERGPEWGTAAEVRKGPSAPGTASREGWVGVPRHHMSDDGAAKLVNRSRRCTKAHLARV